MREGTLLIQNRQLYLDVQGKEQSTFIQLFTHLEIYLSGCWLPSEFQSSRSPDGGIAEPFDLVCTDGTFFGLRSGMRVRMFDPGGLNQSE